MGIEVSNELYEVLQKFADTEGKTISEAVEGIVGGFISIMTRERDVDLVRHRLETLDHALEDAAQLVAKQEDLLRRMRQKYVAQRAAEFAYRASEVGVQHATAEAAAQTGKTG